MSTYRKPAKINAYLEMARARECYGHWCITNDEVSTMRHIKASKDVDSDGVRRIFSYVKGMRDEWMQKQGAV